MQRWKPAPSRLVPVVCRFWRKGEKGESGLLKKNYFFVVNNFIGTSRMSKKVGIVLIILLSFLNPLVGFFRNWLPIGLFRRQSGIATRTALSSPPTVIPGAEAKAFSCFDGLSYAPKLVAEFKRIGFYSEQEVCNASAEYFHSKNIDCCGANLAAYLQTLGVSNLLSGELCCACLKFLPFAKGKIALLEIEATRETFNSRTDKPLELIELNETEDYVVYRKDGAVLMYVGIGPVLQTARDVLSYTVSAAQLRMVIRITGAPKSGKTTAGRDVFALMIDYLRKLDSVEKNRCWSNAKGVAVQYVDVLPSRNSNTLLEKVAMLSSLLGVQQESGGSFLSIQGPLTKYLEDQLPGSIIFVDEIQALFQGLSDKCMNTLADWLRVWMISTRADVQFVVSGSSTPALIYSLRKAGVNGISFFMGANSEVSTTCKIGEDNNRSIQTFERLILKYFPSDISIVNDTLRDDYESLQRSRQYVRVSDLNMLRQKSFRSSEELFARVSEIYLRGIIAAARENIMVQRQLGAVAYADRNDFM